MNALEFYNFDREALLTRAQRIGPSPNDVFKAPADRPADYLGMGMR